MAVPVRLEPGWVDGCPHRQVLTTKVRGKVPCGLADAALLGHLHNIESPADKGLIRGEVELVLADALPLTALIVIDLGRTRQDRKAHLFARHGGIVSLRALADIAPPC